MHRGCPAVIAIPEVSEDKALSRVLKAMRMPQPKLQAGGLIQIEFPNLGAFALAPSQSGWLSCGIALC